MILVGTIGERADAAIELVRLTPKSGFQREGQLLTARRANCALTNGLDQMHWHDRRHHGGHGGREQEVITISAGGLDMYKCHDMDHEKTWIAIAVNNYSSLQDNAFRQSHKAGDRSKKKRKKSRMRDETSLKETKRGYSTVLARRTERKTILSADVGYDTRRLSPEVRETPCPWMRDETETYAVLSVGG